MIEERLDVARGVLDSYGDAWQHAVEEGGGRLDVPPCGVVVGIDGHLAAIARQEAAVDEELPVVSAHASDNGGAVLRQVRLAFRAPVRGVGEPASSGCLRVLGDASRRRVGHPDPVAREDDQGLAAEGSRCLLAQRSRCLLAREAKQRRRNDEHGQRASFQARPLGSS